MRKIVKIALFGAHINSANMGCQALTYSLISLLERISNELQFEFYYTIFEYEPDLKATKVMCRLIDCNANRIRTHNMAPIFRIRSYIFHFNKNIEMLRSIKQCDLAIDITAGDSFSDIYGQNRFISLTVTKLFVELLKVPLILGPQTYGPFYKYRNKKLASKVMQKAYGIIARDKKSAELARKMSKQSVAVTNDLAFMLPYSYKRIYSEKIKLGINVSGLLVKERFESENGNRILLKTDYDEYIEGIVSWVIKSGLYDIFLISHVKEDIEACNIVKNKHAECHVVNFFNNPVDVKSFISGLDIFVGSRMHATIASFTTGVATIPVAYSRKFNGLFDSIGYKRIVDLKNEYTLDAINKTIKYISDFQNLQSEVVSCYEKAKNKNEITHLFFENCILDIFKRNME